MEIPDGKIPDGITVYAIPIMQRETFYGVESQFDCRHTALLTRASDGAGYVLYYSNRVNVDEYVDYELHQVVEKTIYVLASSLEAAVAEVLGYKEFLCGSGESGGELRANWINSGRDIVEYPPCSLMHLYEGDFLCGPHDGTGNGQNGMCALGGDYDPPETGCPIDELLERNRPTFVGSNPSPHQQLITTIPLLKGHYYSTWKSRAASSSVPVEGH